MDAAAIAARRLKIRRIVLTGGVAAITAMGTWYGAGLKIQKDMQEVVKQRREASPAEKIALLEEQRGGLIAQRIGLERKLQELENRANGMSMEESKAGKERRR